MEGGVRGVQLELINYIIDLTDYPPPLAPPPPPRLTIAYVCQLASMFQTTHEYALRGLRVEGTPMKRALFPPA